MTQAGPMVDLPIGARGTFVGATGLKVRTDGVMTYGHAEMGPRVWGTATDRPRFGVLATLVDVVGAMRPSGPITPTVDLNVQLIDALPSRGPIDLVCRPVKAGRTLFVGEVLIHHREALVARAAITFLNRHHDGSLAPARRAANRDGDGDADGDGDVARFDDWFRPQYPDSHTVLIDTAPGILHPNGTIQGGAQAIAAELATEWVLAPHGRFTTIDLDIRYLSALKQGPLAAIADVQGLDDERALVRVRLTDAGAGDHPVAYATSVCRRLT